MGKRGSRTREKDARREQLVRAFERSSEDDQDFLLSCAEGCAAYHAAQLSDLRRPFHRNGVGAQAHRNSVVVGGSGRQRG